ncbi:MAG: hypothetical protein G8D89_22300 [gamma proteobacterium symbiont of Clathrolucina costata]
MIGGESGSERRRSYASASDTPSSHLRECCVARAERSDGVAKRHGRRAAGALIGCRDKRGRKGDWDVPFRILSVTTLLSAPITNLARQGFTDNRQPFYRPQ